jgi:hypothetical protein
MKRLLATLSVATVGLAAGHAHALPACYPDCEEPPPECEPTIVQCSYTPGTVPGAIRGDLIFHEVTSTGGVGELMKKMGLVQTHVGMMLDGSRVRHNTVSKEYLLSQQATDIDGLEWCIFGGADTGDAFIRPQALSDGLPGLHTANLSDEREYLGSSFYWSGTMRRYTAKSTTHRTHTSGAAQRLEALSQTYDLYGFTNFTDARARGGSMCSGSVYDAWLQYDYYNKGGFSLVGASKYSAYYRASVSTPVYDFLYGLIYPIAHAQQDCSAGSITKGIAKQITNAFISGPYSKDGSPYMDFWTGHDCSWWSGTQWKNSVCWDYTQGYDEYVGTGSTISPDDLIAQINGQGTSYSSVVYATWRSPGSTTCVQVPNPDYPDC